MLVMVTQRYESTVHLEMVKMAHSVLCVSYHRGSGGWREEEEERREKGGGKESTQVFIGWTTNLGFDALLGHSIIFEL